MCFPPKWWFELFPIFQDSVIKLPLKSCFFRIGASLQPIPYLTPSKGPSVMSHLRMFRISMSFWHVDYHFPRLLSATEYNSSDPSTPVKVSFERMGERGKEKKKGKKNKKTLIRKYKYPLCGSCARTDLCVWGMRSVIELFPHIKIVETLGTHHVTFLSCGCRQMAAQLDCGGLSLYRRSCTKLRAR